MTRTTIETVTCDECGCVIENGYPPVAIHQSAGGAIGFRLGTVENWSWGSGKEFCSRFCAAIYFLKYLGYTNQDEITLPK